MSGATDQRTGWLATLRRHDEVGVLVPASYTTGPDRYGVATVDSITPTGRITVAGRNYDPFGVERGEAVRRHRQRLAPAAEARAWVEHDDAIEGLRLAVLGLSEATRERPTRRLTATAAQTLTVQIEALREALRLAIGGAS